MSHVGSDKCFSFSKILHFEKELSSLEDTITVSQYEGPVAFLQATLLFSLFSSFSGVTIIGTKVSLIVDKKCQMRNTFPLPAFIDHVVFTSSSRTSFASGRTIPIAKKKKPNPKPTPFSSTKKRKKKKKHAMKCPGRTTCN